MPDAKELANKARITLSHALEMLQSGDDVPESLLELAAPIAKSMGTLHRIEKSGAGEAEHVDAALANVRGVLDSLQELASDDPSIEAAMEAVAGSLSKMFALSKLLKAEPKPVTAAVTQVSTRDPSNEPPKSGRRPEGRGDAKGEESPEPAPRTAKPQVKTVVMPPEKADEHLPDQHEEPHATVMQSPAEDAEVADTDEPRELPHVEAPRSARRPVAPRSGEAARPLPAPRGASAAPDRAATKDKQRVVGTEDAPLPPEGARVQSVELGAYSGSNFYKGLSGNDVIDHGGLFVATYQIPKVGTPVAVRVHLPGDLEFDADAVVEWTREVGDETEPGYGARFTRVSYEARQLVYRYVRNREPMFYDDL